MRCTELRTPLGAHCQSYHWSIYRFIPISNPSARHQDRVKILICLDRLELPVSQHFDNDAVSSARFGWYWNNYPEKPVATPTNAFTREASHAEDHFRGSNIPSSAAAHIPDFLNQINQCFVANNNPSADARDAIHCPLGCRHSHENKGYQG